MPGAGLEKPLLALGKVIETVNRQLPAAEYFGKTLGFFSAAEKEFRGRIKTPAGKRTVVLVQGMEFGDLPGSQQRQGFDAAIGQIPEGGRKGPLKTPPVGDRAEVTSLLDFFGQGRDEDKIAVSRQRAEPFPIQRFSGHGPGQVDEGKQTEVDVVQPLPDKLPSQVEAEQVGPDQNHEGGKAVFFFLPSDPGQESVLQSGLEGSEKKGEVSLFFFGLISFGHGLKSDIIIAGMQTQIKFKF
ncbi:MAG: hypothetical protein AMJ94_03195 [Deltaproteobacteria bacterium SM23_61]|nr:MAG: hypothetical protein AMJ94_03195 [Deltaproteobacteria bacterium SM23_61]